MNLPLRCSVRFAFALFRFYPAQNPHARGEKHSRAGFSTARMLQNFSYFYSKNSPLKKKIPCGAGGWGGHPPRPPRFFYCIYTHRWMDAVFL